MYYSPNFDYLYHCSGVAITIRHILTPAHCVMWKPQKDYRFRTKNKIHPISQIFIHPKYTLDRSDNNIAILQLEGDLNMASGLSLAEDVDPGSLIARRFDVVTLGQGKSGTRSHRTTKITSQAYCQRKFEGLAITELEVCAHIPTDSPVLAGSPLVGIKMENGTGACNLLGISLHGLAKNNPQMPTLFALISTHRQWIEEITSYNYTKSSIQRES
ncbi:vitellin-degrading protease-like isoform X2 [Drosophila miranda]|uniref:vitellin-degrading protease-like isoform X2 n=1 Tax=Drosophila miranda TaxID=7229 RepID=UPI0007E72B7D|nr:vitellin-degrading protease-like isoform X2 [Drosophila miranda]